MSDDCVDDVSGWVKGITTVRVVWTRSASGGGWEMKKVEGSGQFFPADLVLLSMGFLGPEGRVLGDEIEKDARKNVKTAHGKYATNVEGIFAAGDCRRGQSLIVWYVVALTEVEEYTWMLIVTLGASTKVARPRARSISTSKTAPTCLSRAALSGAPPRRCLRPLRLPRLGPWLLPRKQGRVGGSRAMKRTGRIDEV
jgi:NADPH-dependent glutamate synthase beta subunit-like oxidoreductase